MVECGEGEQLWFLGTLGIVRVGGEATDGRFALIEFLFPRTRRHPFTRIRRTRVTSCKRDG
jgi:hypothetical protein